MNQDTNNKTSSKENLTKSSKPKKQSNNEILEVAIIGAGPGGLYTAMRLLEEKYCTSNKIKVFDCLQEYGGRVRSLPLGNLPFAADIGGMRFIEDKQVIITNLLKHKLNMSNEIKDFEVSTNSFYLKDSVLLPKTIVHKKSKKLRKWAKVEYDKNGQRVISDQDVIKKLTPLEEYLSPDELITYAIHKCLSTITFSIADETYVDQEIRKEIKKIRDRMKDDAKEKESESAIEIAKWLKELLQKVPSMDNFTLDQWEYIRNYAFVYDGPRLYNVNLSDVLHEALSPNAIEIVTDALGYVKIFTETNAADFIPWFLNEFGTTKYKTIHKGMSRLNDALYNTISNEIGNTDWLQYDYLLLKIEESKCIRNEKGEEEKVYTLTFRHKNTLQKEEEIKIKAKKIILSVSKGALERIHFDHFKVSHLLSFETNGKSAFKNCIDCVKSYTLIKSFIFYREAWFWNLIPEAARKNINSIPKTGIHKVITDKALRQIYFHGKTGPWKHDNVPEECDVCNAMIMLYGDAEAVTNMISQPDRNKEHKANFVSISQEFINKMYPNPSGNLRKQEEINKEIDKLKELYGAEGYTQKRVHDLLKNMFKNIYKLQNSELLDLNHIEPLAMFIKNWDDKPFYGGWHGWVAGCKPWNIRKEINKPFSNEHIYIVGETFSADQGWIEGAFRTAEYNLKKNFDFMSTPDWLERGLDKLKNSMWDYSKNKSDTTLTKEQKRAYLDNYLKW